MTSTISAPEFEAFSRNGEVAIGRRVDGARAMYPVVQEDGGVRSGMFIGETGSGITHLLAQTAAAVRAATPTITVLLDGYGGAGMPELAKHASYVGRTPGEFEELQSVVGETCDRRWLECMAAREPVHDGPIVLVVVHRPGLVFGERGGEGWFQVLRVGRKQRIGLLMVGESDELGELGRHVGLVGLMPSCVAMRSARNTLAVFGLDGPSLRDLPVGRAVMRGSGRPYEVFDVPHVEDLGDLLERYPDRGGER
jgi:hypothetical protein